MAQKLPTSKTIEIFQDETEFIENFEYKMYLRGKNKHSPTGLWQAKFKSQVKY